MAIVALIQQYYPGRRAETVEEDMQQIVQGQQFWGL